MLPKKMYSLRDKIKGNKDAKKESKVEKVIKKVVKKKK